MGFDPPTSSTEGSVDSSHTKKVSELSTLFEGDGTTPGDGLPTGPRSGAPFLDMYGADTVAERSLAFTTPPPQVQSTPFGGTGAQTSFADTQSVFTTAPTSLPRTPLGGTGAQSSVAALRANFTPQQPPPQFAPPPPGFIPPPPGGVPPPMLAPRATAPRARVEIAPEFPKDFASASIGVESELGGMVCALPENAQARTFAFVRLVGGEPLVQLTKDMSEGAYVSPPDCDQIQGNWKTHTLELVTYPARIADATANQHRRAATQWLNRLMFQRQRSHNHKPLEHAVSDDGLYELVISQSKHRIASGKGKTTDESPRLAMSSMSQQATVGVKASEFGSGGSPELQMLEEAPWYKRGLAAQLNASAAKDARAASAAFAYIASVTEKLASLAATYKLTIGAYQPTGSQVTGLTDPTVKNEWKLLPRTSPTVMLETLVDEEDRGLVKAALATHPGHADASVWTACVKYILDGNDLAGHSINDATVGREPAMLFEFRSGIPGSLSNCVPAEEVQATADPITDPFAELSCGRVQGSSEVRKFAAANVAAAKAAFGDRYAGKTDEQFLKVVAVSQLVPWIIKDFPTEWARLKQLPAPTHGPTVPGTTMLPPPLPPLGNAVPPPPHSLRGGGAFDFAQ